MSSGFIFIKNPVIIEFIHTLLPDPVAPATSKCGSFVKSQYRGALSLPVPKAIGKDRLLITPSLASEINSFNPTTVVF